MIIDSHAHIFPHLDGPCGYPTRADHLQRLQYYLFGHGQPVRRLRDNAIIPNGSLVLFDPFATGPEGLAAVDLRVTRNGRFEWTQDGEDRYIHFMPPSLQTNAFDAEALRVQMAYVGVDAAVLQNAHLYGRLNSEFADAVRRYPGRFIGLAEIDEPNAHRPEEIDRLRAAVRTQRLRGLYYANRSFLWDRFRHAFDDPQYDVLWETVRELGLVVFWEIFGVPVHTVESYLRELDRLIRWQKRFPAIPSILTHGLAPELVLNPPEPIERLFRTEQIIIEILYPISWGREHDYPYLELRPVIRELYRRVGPTRLCWGSDMPNVERHCTYRQSLDYLRRMVDIIPPSEMELVLGGNLARLFEIGPPNG
jgi:predicted TIM-barrel fold metal-dependent hydrolase